MSATTTETVTESAPPTGGSALTIRGEVYDPATITWTPVVPAATITGAVQIAAAFTVTRADGTVLAGEADDYLVRDAAGALLPIPRSIGLLLFRAGPVEKKA